MKPIHEIAIGLVLLSHYSDKFSAWKEIIYAGPEKALSVDTKERKWLEEHGWFVDEETGYWAHLDV